MLRESGGLQLTDSLSIEHIEQALSCLGRLENQGKKVIGNMEDGISNEHSKALINLALKVKTRTH